MLCQRQDLFSEALVVIDGSKFKAVNRRDRNFTSAKLERRMQDIEASIVPAWRRRIDNDYAPCSICSALLPRNSASWHSNGMRREVFEESVLVSRVVSRVMSSKPWSSWQTVD